MSAGGLEPPTISLRGRCSTIELCARSAYFTICEANGQDFLTICEANGQDLLPNWLEKLKRRNKLKDSGVNVVRIAEGYTVSG